MTTGTIIFLVLLLLGVVTAWKGIKTVRRAGCGRWSGSAPSPGCCNPA